MSSEVRPTPREQRRRAASSVFVRAINPDRDNRPELDFYKTPAIATRGLLSVERIEGRVWEPACGDGSIARVLEDRGLRVHSTDLANRGYGRGGVDFLIHRPRHRFDCIVTNPPFTHMMEFARRAVELGPKKVCMIGRLLWLEGKSKKRFLETSGLARVWVFSSRINIAPVRYKPDRPHNGRGGMVAFAWYVWERGYRGSARLGWIDIDNLEDR